MKSIIIHSTETYPDATVQLEGNNFGDQIITLTYEALDGSKQLVDSRIETEGSHLSPTQIKKWAVNSFALFQRGL